MRIFLDKFPTAFAALGDIILKLYSRLKATLGGNTVKEREMFHVSEAYESFWKETITELEKTIYDEKHNPVWRERKLFHLKLNGTMPPVSLNPALPETSAVLFHYIKHALNKEISNSWPQRALSSFSVLNSSGKPYPPAEMAYYLYDITCDNIFSDYSAATGIPLRTISELANIGYEKSDYSGTRLVFDFAPKPRKCFLEFSNVLFSDKNLRAVRKISAGVGEKHALYITRSKSRELVCRGYITVETLSDFPFLITLHGKREWSFSMYGAELFRVAGRQIKATEVVFRESQAVKRLKEELSDFEFTKTDKFDLFLDALYKQKHGTSVIFSTFSSSIIQSRLEKLEKYGRAQALRGFHIVEKSKEEIAELTSMARIDGAFVADLEMNHSAVGNSMYMGVLLDSPAASEGFRGHGSRANSVLAFVQEAMRKAQEAQEDNFKIAALVFSEDGYVLPILGSEALQY